MFPHCRQSIILIVKKRVLGDFFAHSVVLIILVLRIENFVRYVFVFQPMQMLYFSDS